MGQKPQGTPADFSVGQAVRYRPGIGTYGFEAAIQADGRIPARVIALTASRVRIGFAVPMVGSKPRPIERAVDAASLLPEAS